MGVRKIITVVLAAVLLPSISIAEEPAAKGADGANPKKKIIMKSIDAKYLADDEAQSLETLVCSALASNKAYDVACPADVNALMKEQSLRMAMGACTGAACGNADRILKSDMTAAAVVQSADERYILTMTLNATDSGEELAKASVGTAAKAQSLCDKIPQVVKELYTNLSKPRPPQPPPPAKPVEQKAAPEKAAPQAGTDKK